MKKKMFSPAGLFLLTTALSGAVLFSSCKKDDDNKTTNHMYTISGTGNGSQVVPAFTGSGVGNITGTYNSDSNLLNYTVSWDSLTGDASNVGFYNGAAGVAGTSVQELSVTTPGATGNATGTLTLTDAQESDLLNNNWYYSIGTLANSTGEVRGQITAKQ